MLNNLKHSHYFCKENKKWSRPADAPRQLLLNPWSTICLFFVFMVYGNHSASRLFRLLLSLTDMCVLSFCVFAVFSLQDLCCRAIVSCTPVHLIDKLPLPVAIKSHLKSFSMANGMNAVMMHGRSYSLANAAGGSKGNSLKRSKSIRPPQSPPQNCTRNNCKIS